MKIAYFDCVSGASGDMILGALIDSGLAAEQLEAELAKLNLDDFHLHVKRVMKNAFSATKVDVHAKDSAPERHLSDLKKVVEDSALSESVKAAAIRIFTRICEAEAAIHNSDVNKVHLHEVGGVDAIVDICGALAGLELLGIDEVHVSPLPLGRGFVKGAHGQIPLPAPATLSLLKGCPVVGSEIEKELVTPTGAAILTEVASGFGPIPTMTLASTGYGAGTADFKTPNVIRLLIGEGGLQPGGLITEALVQLETNLDDESPEIIGHVSRKLISEGALDVAILPVQMKKDRPGSLVQVLCKPGQADKLQQILLAETSTLGVRRNTVRRDSLPRRIEKIATDFGEIRVKVSGTNGASQKAIPEYEDCRAAAEKSGKALREIFKLVEHKAQHALGIGHHHHH